MLRIVTEGKTAINASKSKDDVDNSIISTKNLIDEVVNMKVSTVVFYTLQEAYDQGFITRVDLMHIAFFASGEVLDKDLNKIDFVPKVEEPKYSEIELRIRCSLKTTIYQKDKHQFDRYNYNINDIRIYRYFGEYNGYYSVQVQVPYIHYGAMSYLEIVSDIAWYHFDAPIIVFTMSKE